MIKINVIKNNDAVEKISILGHAGYDIYGKDIVCASVSSIVITTVNAILRFDDKALTYDQLKDDLEYDQITLKEYIDPFTGEPVKTSK